MRTEPSKLLRGGAAGALTALIAWSQPAWAQEAATGEGQAEAAQERTTTGAEAAGSEAGDRVVVTVNDNEIRDSEVMAVIEGLPPALQEQPLETLMPLAVDHLLLRELILERARSENLAEDEEVTSLVESSGPKTEEDAMVQVWLNREIESRVSDEDVQKAYDDAKAGSAQDLPPLEQARPQIRMELGRQALSDIRASLLEGSDIVFYGPDGEPLDPTEAPAGN